MVSFTTMSWYMSKQLLWHGKKFVAIWLLRIELYWFIVAWWPNMWGKIIIPMYRLWLNGLYGLYGPRCPLFSKRPINLISLSLSLSGDPIWWHRSGSALAQLMACCLTEPRHYLNQCWLVIIGGLWPILWAISQKLLTNLIHNMSSEIKL